VRYISFAFEDTGCSNSYLCALCSNVFQLSGMDYAAPFREEGVSYQNFVKFQMSLRMKLLQLRDSHPHLFTEPIPLSEQIIKSSELYKQIIAKHFPAMVLGVTADDKDDVGSPTHSCPDQ
jgi:hypothetical protein